MPFCLNQQEQRKKERIALRLEPELLEEVKFKAKEKGLDLSEYVREKLRND